MTKLVRADGLSDLDADFMGRQIVMKAFVAQSHRHYLWSLVVHSVEMRVRLSRPCGCYNFFRFLLLLLLFCSWQHGEMPPNYLKNHISLCVYRVCVCVYAIFVDYNKENVHRRFHRRHRRRCMLHSVVSFHVNVHVWPFDHWLDKWIIEYSLCKLNMK